MRKMFIILFIFIFSLLCADGIEPLGSGTEDDPYLIETLDNLVYMSCNDTICANENYFIQTCDIDASETEIWNDGAGFTPINLFSGFYDGQYHKIQNLHINITSSHTGFIQYCHGNIYNLGLVNVDINGGYVVGAIAAYMNSWAVVKNCFSTGTVSGSESVGGLVGVMNNWSVIQESYSHCDVSGNSSIGGLIGYLALRSEIFNSYATGMVDGGSNTGGFVGGVANNCYIHNCYSTGVVIGGTSSGGFEGQHGAGSIINCFWDVESSGCPEGMYHAGDGVSTEEMHTMATYLNAGWDFIGESSNGNEEIWGMHFFENNCYPFLYWQGYTHDLVNDPPELVNELDNISVSEDFTEQLNINLENYFTDPDGYSLDFSFSSNSNIVNCTLTDSILNISSIENMNGSIDISVTAEDTFIPVNRTSHSRESTVETFTINIEPVNDSPEIVSYLPEQLEIELFEEQEILFVIESLDIDSDLDFCWFVNEQVQDSSTNSFTKLFSNNGMYNIKVITSDGEFGLETEWIVSANVTDFTSDSVVQFETKLLGNYPNPFNPATSISYTLNETGIVQIDVYNSKGQYIKSLLNQEMNSGKHSVIWNGYNKHNITVSSGYYFYSLKVNGKLHEVKKCLLLK